MWHFFGFILVYETNEILNRSPWIYGESFNWKWVDSGHFSVDFDQIRWVSINLKWNQIFIDNKLLSKPVSHRKTFRKHKIGIHFGNYLQHGVRKLEKFHPFMCNFGRLQWFQATIKTMFGCMWIWAAFICFKKKMRIFYRNWFNCSIFPWLFEISCVYRTNATRRMSKADNNWHFYDARFFTLVFVISANDLYPFQKRFSFVLSCIRCECIAFACLYKMVFVVIATSNVGNIYLYIQCNIIV